MAFFFLFPKLEETIARRFTRPSHASNLSQSVHGHVKLYSVSLISLEDLLPPTSEKKFFASGVGKSDLDKNLKPIIHSHERNEIDDVSIQNRTPIFYQRIACYTKSKKLPSPPVPFALLSVHVIPYAYGFCF